MEQRLIDGKDLFKLICEKYIQPKWGYGFTEATYMVATEIENAPTIDPIHAAGGCYCRECKHWTRIQCENGECSATSNGVVTIKKATGFCDCGKRREQNGKQ